MHVSLASVKICPPLALIHAAPCLPSSPIPVITIPRTRLPNVSAAAETLPGFENLGWFGFMLPAATPRAVVEKLYKDTAAVLKAPDIAQRFEQIGMVPVGNAPDAMARDIREESGRWAKIVKQRKLQVE